jgi:hypothetical protein
VDHYYIPHTSIWFSDIKKSTSPLWKSIFSLRNKIIEQCGGILEVQEMLSSWHSGSGTFSANAYKFFRYKTAHV